MALTTVQAGILATPAQYTAMKNRIINGAMVIQQRGNSPLTNTATTSSNYCLDRWTSECTQASKMTITQSSTAPAGFNNSALITSTSAYSVGSGDYFTFEQRIEGYNVADLGWGTASAKTVTLSFWVQSSLTGTFGGCLGNGSANRSYPFTYTISAANTWEQKTVTISGDTTGTWATTNTAGINVYFGLGVGSTYSGTAGSWSANGYVSATGATSVVGTNGATFYLTGVQLEVGSSATGYEYRQYQQELALCQRYYYKLTSPYSTYTAFGLGSTYSSTSLRLSIPLPVTMRSTPLTLDAASPSLFLCEQQAGAPFTPSAIALIGNQSPSNGFVGFTISGGTAGITYNIYSNNNTTAYLGFGAEL